MPAKRPYMSQRPRCRYSTFQGRVTPPPPAIALGLAAGAEAAEAAALANVAAGIVVGKRGTATVSTGEIIAVLRPFDGRRDPQKIFALDTVLQLARGWREQGLKIAFTNGCFDLLHPGHISLLEQARRCADRLIVGMNTDLSIRRLKGPNRPVQSEVARATVLAAVEVRRCRGDLWGRHSDPPH